MTWLGVAIAVILVICLFFMIRHFYDSPTCSMAEDSKYRSILCNSVHRDFSGALEQLLEILDEIKESAKRTVPDAFDSKFEVTNEYVKSSKEIYNKCLLVNKTAREIWASPKYTKDFYFFAGLHFISRYVGNILEGELRGIKQFLNACKQAQQTLNAKVTVLRGEQMEEESFNRRRELSANIDALNQNVKDLINLETRFTEIDKVYSERTRKQNIETNKRADFIAKHFKRLGPEWRTSMSIHPRRS